MFSTMRVDGGFCLTGMVEVRDSMRLDSTCVWYNGSGVAAPAGVPLLSLPGIVGRAVVLRFLSGRAAFSFAGIVAVSQMP